LSYEYDIWTGGFYMEKNQNIPIVRGNGLFDNIPENLALLIKRFAREQQISLEDIEEIRLRAGKNPVVRACGKNYRLLYKTSEKALVDTLNYFTGYSFYAFKEQISEGYITINGGHRVGISGSCIMEDGKIKLIRSPASLNIRQAKEVPGCADMIIPHILRNKSGLMSVSNTLVISPPKCGKTTILRDIIRQISRNGITVSVCDERSELAGLIGAASSFDLGPNTDILSGCPKSEGISMLLRSMAPEVIATDEIGTAAGASKSGMQWCLCNRHHAFIFT